MNESATRRGLLAGAGAGLAALAGCLNIQLGGNDRTTTVESSYDAAALDRVRVFNTSGDVTVRSTAGDEVEVRAHKSVRGDTEFSDLTVEGDADDGELTLRARVTNTDGLGNGGSLDVTVRVPDGVALERVETDAGDADISEVGGDPEVVVDAGDVEVTDVGGGVTVETDTGDARIGDARGTVSASTSDGDLTVTDSGALGDLRTDTGDVEADVPAVEGEATIETDDGDVVATLGPDLDASVDAQSSTGDVTVTGGPLDATDTVGEHHVEGQVGAGTGTLRIRTDTGDVTLRGG
jgi:hypothetical protein